jgi:hypothetical protein
VFSEGVSLFLAQVSCGVLGGGEDLVICLIFSLPSTENNWSEALQKNLYAVIFLSVEELFKLSCCCVE